jgi:hypothetical protein
MMVAAIDPGKKGYVVVLDSKSDQAHKFKLEFDAQGGLDGHLLQKQITESKAELILLEKVMGRSGWSATNNFNFGSAWGQLYQIIRLSNLPHRLVVPQQWQKIIHQGIDGKLEAKEKSLVAYTQFFPHNPIPRGPRSGKIDDNLLDAMLIATYGVMEYAKDSFRSWGFVEVGV